MKNRLGFIPKRYEQPAYYKNCFNAWCAVYYGSNDEEIHLQLILDPWEWQNGFQNAKGIEILRQGKEHRTSAFLEEFKSISQAVNKLRLLL